MKASQVTLFAISLISLTACGQSGEPIPAPIDGGSLVGTYKLAFTVNPNASESCREDAPESLPLTIAETAQYDVSFAPSIQAPVYSTAVSSTGALNLAITSDVFDSGANDEFAATSDYELGLDPNGNLVGTLTITHQYQMPANAALGTSCAYAIAGIRQ